MTGFVAFGLISWVDSIPAVVTWSASTGTIAPDAEYTAGRAPSVLWANSYGTF